MDAFFENLGKKVGQTMNTVGKKTDNFIDVQKLKNKASTLERQCEKCRMDIGEIIFQRFLAGDLQDAELIPLCEELTQTKKELEKYQEAIAGKKGQEICPACGQYAPKGAAFCPACGEIMNKVNRD